VRHLQSNLPAVATGKGRRSIQSQLTMSHLSKFFHSLRLTKGLSLGQLARLIGYRNISKGANRIRAFENSGAAHPELFAKLAAALEIDQATIDQLANEDRRDWNEWANEPIKPSLVIRLMAAIYVTRNLPTEIQNAKEAIAWAAEVAKDDRKRCCLVLSRRISFWFAADGTVEQVTEAVPGEINTPAMFLGSKTRPCLFKEVEQGIALKEIQWPKGKPLGD
jgi:transcriptional regulator with XRE-family HTH domain